MSDYSYLLAGEWPTEIRPSCWDTIQLLSQNLLTINKDIYSAIKILHSQLIYPSVILDIVLYFKIGKKCLIAVQATD